MSPDRRRASLRIAPALLLAAAVSAGCGADSLTGPGTSPLTGLERSGDAPGHPVMVVKVDNTDAATPQVGLDRAELVVEELVEGGLTRLAVFFDEDLPDEVGPVRSMRASDVPVVLPTGGTVITSGAAGVTKKLLDQAGVDYVEERGDEPGFRRDPARTQPYDLIADPRALAAELDAPAESPADYLPWGTADDFAEAPGRTAGRTLQATFSPSHTTAWEYQKGEGYRVVDDRADAPFPADSVLVLRVKEGDAGYLDPAGNRVPETVLTGTGKALLCHGGRALAGTWSKGEPDEPLTLERKDGEDLTVPAGRVWVELVPVEGDVTAG